MFSRNRNFIERSIMGALSFLKESVFAGEYALLDGLLQRLDPRIKTSTFLLFIILVLFAKNISVLLWLYAAALLLAAASKINLGFFLKRTWIFIPLFSLFIALPAIFSVFTPGEALISMRIGTASLTITRPGLKGAALFIMRVADSVSFVVLLSITTRHFEFLKVLRFFRIPQVFVMVIGMCYRYCFLFVEIVENTYLAIKSRAGNAVRYKKGRHIVTWNIASLWSRSCQLNEDVYNAMLSRGYRGEPVILNDFKVMPRDFLWLVIAIIISVPAVLLNFRS